MASKRPSVLKREREKRQAERAEQKRAERARREASRSTGNGPAVATHEDLAGYGLGSDASARGSR
jgi:hypothetical protein